MKGEPQSIENVYTYLPNFIKIACLRVIHNISVNCTIYWVHAIYILFKLSEVAS